MPEPAYPSNHNTRTVSLPASPLPILGSHDPTPCASFPGMNLEPCQAEDSPLHERAKQTRLTKNILRY